MIDSDLELQRLNDAVRRAYAIRTSDWVLDIGCGAGQTTREAAELATAGVVVGIGRSEAMIERARALTRATGLTNVAYECADAERQARPRERFDAAISRFGTMFFEDPAAAFSNIRGALRSGGRLVMMVWQAAHRNEWPTSIERALASGEAEPVRSPFALQPFSPGDPDTVRRILRPAGFATPTLDEVHEPVCYGTDGDAAFELVSQFTFVQEAIARLDDRERARALDRLRHLLAAHRRADGVWSDSRAWIVSARRS